MILGHHGDHDGRNPRAIVEAHPKIKCTVPSLRRGNGTTTQSGQKLSSTRCEGIASPTSCRFIGGKPRQGRKGILASAIASAENNFRFPAESSEENRTEDGKESWHLLYNPQRIPNLFSSVENPNGISSSSEGLARSAYPGKIAVVQRPLGAGLLVGEKSFGLH
jgi:hypothetical protein